MQLQLKVQQQKQQPTFNSHSPWQPEQQQQRLQQQQQQQQ